MKKRIFTHFMLLLSAAIAVTMVLMTLLTYNMFEQRVIDDLRVDAKVLSSIMDNGIAQKAFVQLNGDLRVTMIAGDGEVLYDNHAQADSMDNHLDRKEVEQALRTGEGHDARQSRTVEKSTFYYAVRTENGGVLRVGKEVSNIWSIYIRVLPLLLLLTLLMILLSALAAGKLTDRLLAPVQQLATDMDGTQDAVYPELQPFVRTIKSQHDEILKNANMRVEFTANVSHELKTPLTSISGYAELIESGMAEGEQARKFAHGINKSAKRLLTLINDIIRLSEMDAPEQVSEQETMDLAQATAGVAEQLALSAERMDVQLETDVHPCMISGEKRLIEELIFNLCDNAIRYNVRGGHVRLRVYPVRDRAILQVQDTGIGIDKENQERVFERFYRVDKSRSKATGGTGLGLAIVKHIAARHEAQISMESELGTGTTITVSFERLRG